MEQHLASHFCDSLGMSVILYREDETADYRCLSSHLCGSAPCGREAYPHREDLQPPSTVG